MPIRTILLNLKRLGFSRLLAVPAGVLRGSFFAITGDEEGDRDTTCKFNVRLGVVDLWSGVSSVNTAE